ncbi:laccase-15-like [Senna tora]|uniref:Laccase n=1 Tax=Senna tora TaxID=362788 RepID=A0A834TDX1_9FABA|nr:laccase-15-like [Senna tora]
MPSRVFASKGDASQIFVQVLSIGLEIQLNLRRLYLKVRGGSDFQGSHMRDLENGRKKRRFVAQLNHLLICHAIRRFSFEVKEASYTRLCSTKKILTINGKFPGPTLYVTKGETIIVDVYNTANYNITIHWHGVNMPRYPWSDGPEFITQCPIQPGHKFSQKVIFSEEEGTLWWHAHSDYSRATVYGAIVVKPKPGTTYPFPKPKREFPIILGEWWKQDIVQVFNDFRKNGGDPMVSDAYTINGQPETFKLKVVYGKTYLLRIINAALENILFFSIANHSLTIVGSDGSYLKPIKVDHITISPGQTIDVLLEANQPLLLSQYYMAARAFSSNNPNLVPFNPTTTTSILQYEGKVMINNTSNSLPSFPNNSLPSFNDTKASTNLISQFKSLYPIVDLPLLNNVTTKLLYTASVNSLPCGDEKKKNGSAKCLGPNRNRFSASMNNISFQLPSGSNILEAYYGNVSGNNLPVLLLTPSVGTEVNVLEYGSKVELVLQGTNLLAGTEHPIHLHGHSFYVVGWGFGKFDEDKDPFKYNLVDPPYQNTITIPKNGWVSIRFRAKNPGVWFMHCHLERHVTWGMATTFIVKNGKNPEEKMLPPPPHMPKC